MPEWLDNMEHREWYSIRGRMPLELRRRLAAHAARVEESAGTRVGKSAILRGLLERGLDAAEGAELPDEALPYRLEILTESATKWKTWGSDASLRRAESRAESTRRWGMTHWRVVHVDTGDVLAAGEATDGR